MLFFKERVSLFLFLLPIARLGDFLLKCIVSAIFS